MNHCKICNKELLKRQKQYCSNICKFSDKTYNEKRVSLVKNDTAKFLVSKIDGWKTNDILNKSGTITKYLSNKKIPIDNFIQYFDVFDSPKIETMKCPYCDWTTKDLKNSSGVFTAHIKKLHKKTVSDFLIENPSFCHLWKTFQGKEDRLFHINESECNCVECKICGEKLKEITNSHLKKHNLTCEEYKESHGDLVSKFTKQEFIDNLEKVEFDSSSKAEREIREYLLQISPTSKFIYNCKKVLYPQETDIFVEDRNLGIEYNGLYFHSELLGGRLKDYHLNKTEISDRCGIKLIQIFEDEWRDKKDIVKCRINNLMGVSKKKLDARKLIIKSPTREEKTKFLNENHLQGNDKSSVFIGLYDNDLLVSIMTFSRPRLVLGMKNREDGVWELVRFCNMKDWRVRGAFSKLLSSFKKSHSPKKILTYADRRWSIRNDNVYEKNGFSFIKYTKPNYFYTKGYKTRLHRFNFTKSNLIQKYGFSNDMTEIEIMRKLRYDRIWDCGHLKYELKFD